MITWDDIAEAVNQYFEIAPEPSAEDGWFTVNQAMTLPVFQGQTREGVRNLLKRRAERGLLEQTRWGRYVYYRIPR